MASFFSNANDDSLQNRKEKVKALRDEKRKSAKLSSDEEEEYELIDATAVAQVADEGASVVHKYAEYLMQLDLSRKSTYTQLAIGGAAGWVTGYVCGKVGRTVATALGGTMLLLHAGTQAGYVTVDWEKVDSDMKEAGKAVSKKLEEQKNDERTQRIVNQSSTFVRRNLASAGGFAAGFFLGLAS